MRIRKATLEDAAELARLHRGTIRAINKNDYSEKEIAAWSARATAKRVRNSHDLAIRYVAIEDGKIIGFTDISKENPEKLWGLYVHKDWIGTGVGSALLSKIEEVAKSLGVKKFVAMATLTAKDFYERKGFSVIKKEKHQIDDQMLDVLLMEKVFEDNW